MDILKTILENEEYLRDFITRSTYNSNAIEGNKLTLAETRETLYCDMNLIINADGRSVNEAINHKSAMEYVFSKIDNTITEQTIKDINTIINSNIQNFSGYRKVAVIIKNAKHIPPEANLVPNKMMYFIYNYHNDNIDIFEKVAKYHIEFEKIHPFEDGNGRTGRILINYELIKNNIAPIVIEKEDRNEYLNFLEREDYKGFAKWIEILSNQEEKRLEYFELVKNQKQSEEEEER